MICCVVLTNINIIPHLHNLFLFQCDVTRSLNCYESPEQTVYWPSAYNSVSTVSVYWPKQVEFCVNIDHNTSCDKYDSFKNLKHLFCLSKMFLNWLLLQVWYFMCWCCCFICWCIEIIIVVFIDIFGIL